MEVLEAVCSAAGGCVSSAGQRAENWLTEERKGAGLLIWLIGVTDILDTLCCDCSQTSLVRPYPLVLAILRTSFSIVLVGCKEVGTNRENEDQNSRFSHKVHDK